jgi:hypothetical protein
MSFRQRPGDIHSSASFRNSTMPCFFYALGQGLGLDAARTMVVNTIVVLEIFYLFNVRYLI